MARNRNAPPVSIKITSAVTPAPAPAPAPDGIATSPAPAPAKVVKESMLWRARFIANLEAAKAEGCDVESALAWAKSKPVDYSPKPKKGEVYEVGDLVRCEEMAPLFTAMGLAPDTICKIVAIDKTTVRVQFTGQTGTPLTYPTTRQAIVRA